MTVHGLHDTCEEGATGLLTELTQSFEITGGNTGSGLDLDTDNLPQR